MNRSQSYHEFWTWFENSTAALAVSGKNDPIREVLLEHLHRINSELFYEISVAEKPYEFVITAEGKKHLFSVAKSLAGAAPRISDWRIVGLKPPMGFGFEIEYDGVSIDVSSIRFFPLMNRAVSPVGLGLRIAVPDYDVMDDRRRQALRNAILVALDTGLGEELAGAAIKRVEVVGVPEGYFDEGYSPLLELPGYINWFMENRDKF